MSDQTRIDRRRFARSLAFGSTALAALIAVTAPLTAADPADREPSPNGDPAPHETATPVVPPSQEALLLTLLTQRYPSEHYDETALKGIYGDLRGDVARGKILSDFPLKNSDQPSPDFRVFRGAE